MGNQGKLLDHSDELDRIDSLRRQTPCAGVERVEERIWW
jgi:hypothetical protein